MSILIRAGAAYLILLAVVVAVNFVATPLYHPGGDEPFAVWEILNWFMAAGMLITVAAAYMEKTPCRRRGGLEALRGSERALLRSRGAAPSLLLELVQQLISRITRPTAKFG